MTATESIASAVSAEFSAPLPEIDRALIDELWRACSAASWGLHQEEFAPILLDGGAAQNFGLPDGTAASPSQQAAFFRALCLDDLVLARACALGNERAWEHFLAVYRQPLIRAAVAITGSETLGRDLADQLYGELYGLTERDGARRCPLLSYRGRGSLMGWLRTTLAQRHVDHHRRNWRLMPMEESTEEKDAQASEPLQEIAARELSLLERATEEALGERDAETRYLLAAYYLDGQTLRQIAGGLGVHEATASRKLQRAIGEIRRQILRNLECGGLSRRAAEETLGVDVRDLEVNLRKLLQYSQMPAFKEQAGL
jgi:RNA polymerase sigma-70 factor (ECF subfamily)